MEADNKKLLEKTKSLIELAKKKKNALEYQEIQEYFRDMNLSEKQLDAVVQYLEEHDIDVLRISEGTADEDEDDTLLMNDEPDLEDEEEVDMENIDLSVPEGISIEDPVRMYLMEIGKVPLLTAEEEIDLAKVLGKKIIAVEPWGAQRTSEIVKNAADEIVGWNTASIVKAIRGY